MTPGLCYLPGNLQEENLSGCGTSGHKCNFEPRGKREVSNYSFSSPFQAPTVNKEGAKKRKRRGKFACLALLALPPSRPLAPDPAEG